MPNTSKTKLQELQAIINRLPIDVCFRMVQQDFGVKWRVVMKAIRNARLPITSSSIGIVLCKMHAKRLPLEEIDYILSRLRLKLIAVQRRVWHVITLKEPLHEVPLEPANFQESILAAFADANRGKNIHSEVQTVQLGGLVFISVQLSSDTRSGAPLYLATPMGQPVAMTSSIRAGKLLKISVQGLGYNTYEDACLHGHHIPSLLRVHGGCDENVDRMLEVPEYCPMPVVTKTGIDYTNRAYDENHVDRILGPDPPLLTTLCVTTTPAFFERNLLDKPMRMTLRLKSDDVAKTLKSWALRGALAPTSNLFTVFNKLKSNQINNYEHGDDSD